MSEIIQNRRTYQPFPFLVKPNGYAPDTDTMYYTAIPVHYMPLILGALKILARRETYIDDENNDAQLAARRGHLLLSMFDEYSPTPPALNWHFVFTNFASPIASFDMLPLSPAVQEVERFGFGYALAETTDFLHFRIHGEADSMFGELVAGHVHEFTCSYDDFTLVSSFIVFIKYADGSQSVVTYSSSFTLQNIDVFFIDVLGVPLLVTSPQAATFAVSWYGPFMAAQG